MKKLLAIATFAVSTAFFFSCNSKTETSETKSSAAYVCPMKCEGSDSDKAGQCKVCHMDLVKNEG